MKYLRNAFAYIRTIDFLRAALVAMFVAGAIVLFLVSGFVYIAHNSLTLPVGIGMLMGFVALICAHAFTEAVLTDRCRKTGRVLSVMFFGVPFLLRGQMVTVTTLIWPLILGVLAVHIWHAPNPKESK